MKPFYTAYAKSIDGITFYFVKTFRTFPDLNNVPPVLETYGMHTNFEQACKIAQVYDKETQQQLLNELETNTTSSKVLPLYPSVGERYSLRRKHIAFPSILKLLRLG